MHIQVSLMIDIDATADLATIEHQVQDAGHQGMRQALRQTIRQWEQAHRTCPHCGSQQVRGEGTVARTIHALFGSVRLARQRLRCLHCFRRFCPANQLFEQMLRGRVSPALAEAASLAGASWPYRHAAQVLARLSGAQISAEEIRLLTNRRGRALAKQQEPAHVDRVVTFPPQEEEGKEGPVPADRLIIGLDGGWMPSREQRGGMEGKVAVIATDKEVLREANHPSAEMSFYEMKKYVRRHRHPSVRRARWRTRRYVATFARSSMLGQQAAEAVSQIGHAQQEQVVIADGAEWIKKETQKHFSDATCILDWPHLWRTIAKAVRAVGVQREADQKWVHQHVQQMGTW